MLAELMDRTEYIQLQPLQCPRRVTDGRNSIHKEAFLNKSFGEAAFHHKVATSYPHSLEFGSSLLGQLGIDMNYIASVLSDISLYSWEVDANYPPTVVMVASAAAEVDRLVSPHPSSTNGNVFREDSDIDLIVPSGVLGKLTSGKVDQAMGTNKLSIYRDRNHGDRLYELFEYGGYEGKHPLRVHYETLLDSSRAPAVVITIDEQQNKIRTFLNNIIDVPGETVLPNLGMFDPRGEYYMRAVGNAMIVGSNPFVSESSLRSIADDQASADLVKQLKLLESQAIHGTSNMIKEDRRDFEFQMNMFRYMNYFLKRGMKELPKYIHALDRVGYLLDSRLMQLIMTSSIKTRSTVPMREYLGLLGAGMHFAPEALAGYEDKLPSTTEVMEVIMNNESKRKLFDLAKRVSEVESKLC